jgi:hypothetical protein
MDQYAYDDKSDTPMAQTTHTLQAQVMPEIVELKWENKVLRVPNPEYVRQLAKTCAQQATDLQQMKDRQISMQTQIQQLQRVVQQLQNSLLG